MANHNVRMVGSRDYQRELRNLGSTADPLGQLEALTQVGKFIQLYLDNSLLTTQTELVRRARSRDDSWATIGRALGMTGQAANRKFGELLK